MNSHKQILEKRSQIDKLDNKIVELLDKRFDLAIKLGLQKEKIDTPFFSPPREAEVIRKLTRNRTNRFPQKNLLKIFSEIISVCRNAQKKTQVILIGRTFDLTHSALISALGTELCISAAKIEELSEKINDNFDAIVAVPWSSNNILKQEIIKFICSNNFYIIQEINYIPKLVAISKEEISIGKIKKVLLTYEMLPFVSSFLSQNFKPTQVSLLPSIDKIWSNLTYKKNGVTIVSQEIAETLNAFTLPLNIANNCTSIFKCFLVSKKANTEFLPPLEGGFFIPIKDESAVEQLTNLLLEKHIFPNSIEIVPYNLKSWHGVIFVRFSMPILPDKWKNTESTIIRKFPDSKFTGFFPSNKQIPK